MKATYIWFEGVNLRSEYLNDEKYLNFVINCLFFNMTPGLNKC